MNLAIVFGPTLFRDATNSMASMIVDTPSQARIVQVLLNEEAYFAAEAKDV